MKRSMQSLTTPLLVLALGLAAAFATLPGGASPGGMEAPAGENSQPHAGSDSHDDNDNDNDGDKHTDNEDHDAITLAPDTAREAGLGTAIAGAGSIERHVTVYGRLATPPDQVVQSRARFPGLIRDIRVNIGDTVKRDQVLAVIESNESLRSYELRAPIDAQIQDRQANVGEITGEGALFTLVNNRTLWAQLRVFPSLRFEVAPGQTVHVDHNGHLHDSTIASVTPGPLGEAFVVARVVIPNPQGDMAPGDMVKAEIDAETVDVPLAVATTALQDLQGQTVVFVQRDDRYQARPVTTGRSDGQLTEIVDGLEAGERYVALNSFLLKAELLKSGAKHDH